MGMKSGQRKPIEMRMDDPTQSGEINPGGNSSTGKRTGAVCAMAR
jgi:hypothetical protein